MNIALWILQILLAAHTAIGAVWKFSNGPAQTMPSLGAIPQSVWIFMAVLELVIVAALVVPLFKKTFIGYVKGAAALIVAEMILFSVLHLVADEPNKGPMVYWLLVAAVAGFIFYGRFKRV